MKRIVTVNLKNRYDHYPYDERIILQGGWRLALEWFDGHKSAFWRLTEDEDVPVDQVIKELDGVISARTVTPEDIERAQLFRIYCLKLKALAHLEDVVTREIAKVKAVDGTNEAKRQIHKILEAAINKTWED